MKRAVFLLYLLTHLTSYARSQSTGCLASFSDTSSGEPLFGYKDQNGVTIIAAKYRNAYSKRLCHYAIVITTSYRWIGINRKDSTLWEAYIFDNLPDVEKQGLFRVKVNEKVGFANVKGEIVIPPAYTGAGHFSQRLAAVNIGGQIETIGEHSFVRGGLWGYIDKNGRLVIQPQFLEASGFEKVYALVKTREGKEVRINKKGIVTE